MLNESTATGQPAGKELQAARPRILVIGLGNPILGDDGAGWQACQCVQARLENEYGQETENYNTDQAFSPEQETLVNFECYSLGGLALMERMVGYTHAVIIDAITTMTNPVGTVQVFPLADIPRLAMGHLASAHDTSLQNALQMGRMLDAQLPTDIMIVGIEAQAVYDFCEELSNHVAAALPKASDLALEQINNWIHAAELQKGNQESIKANKIVIRSRL